MKKRIHIFIFIFMIIVQTYAQHHGSRILKIQYSETITYKSNIVNKYLGTLITKDEYSYYKSEFLNTVKGETENEEGEIIIDNNKNIDLSYEIFTNTKTKELTENKFENLFLKKHFSIYEDYPIFKWELQKGSKKILKYNCKKARITFRGRTYNVYYTEDIPISIGPWKFNGLPGLILSVEDEKGIYKWEASSIKYPLKVSDIDIKELYKKRNKYSKLSFKEFDLKFINSIKDKISIVRSRSARNGMNAGFSFSTFQQREPINEYRTQMQFE